MSFSGLVQAFSGPDLFPIFAHQGEWDEILLVLAPLGALGALLFLANRRLAAKLRGKQESSHSAADS